MRRYTSVASPLKRWHEALLDKSKRWKKHVQAYKNKLTGDEPDVTRKAGEDAIDFFLYVSAWNDAFRPLPPRVETDEQKFYRVALASRAYLMRVLFYYMAQFELHISAIDVMLRVGEMLQYVCFWASLHVTYSFVYLTKWNASALRDQVPLIRVGPEHIMGFGSLASAQGWERLHAFLKFMFPMLTNRHKGAEEKYLQCRSLLQVRIPMLSKCFSNAFLTYFLRR